MAESSAWAYECTAKAPLCEVSARWVERRIPYAVRTPPPDASMTEAELVEAVHDAFEVWSSVGCTFLDFEFMGVLGPDEPYQGVHEIRVFTEGWPGLPGALAVTNVAFGSFSGRVSTATVSINDQFNDFTDAARGECSGAFDLRATLVHEFGHFLGFSHPCEFMNEEGHVESPITGEGEGQGEGKGPALCESGKECPRASCAELLPGLEELPTMWPLLDPCDVSLRTLSADELEAVCTIYPRTGPSQPCYALPEREGELVKNRPFGCSQTGAQGSADFALLLLLGLIMRWRRDP